MTVAVMNCNAVNLSTGAIAFGDWTGAHRDGDWILYQQKNLWRKGDVGDR